MAVAYKRFDIIVFDRETNFYGFNNYHFSLTVAVRGGFKCAVLLFNTYITKAKLGTLLSAPETNFMPQLIQFFS